jgi:hypothetical protein
MVDDVPVLADNPRATVLVLVSLYLGELEIIIDLPIGFPIHDYLSLGEPSTRHTLRSLRI